MRLALVLLTALCLAACDVAGHAVLVATNVISW